MPAPSSVIARKVGFTAALRGVWWWSLVVGAYAVLPVVVGRVPLTERINAGG